MKIPHEEIKRLRLQKNISQVDMADAAGMSRSAYISFEKNGSENIPLKSAVGIANKLEKSFNELFEIKGTGSKIIEFEKEKEELQEKIQALEKQIADKDMLIEMFKNEKVRIRKDLLHFLEEIHDTNTYYLKEMRKTIGLKDWQISEIQQTMINLITTISTSYFMGVGLINEEDWDKVTGKYIGKVRPADKPKEDKD
jgi:transcriptional regulator with XRE-family HTH domain